MKKGTILSNYKSGIFVEIEDGIVFLDRFSQINIGYFEVPTYAEIIQEDEYLSRGINELNNELTNKLVDTMKVFGEL